MFLFVALMLGILGTIAYFWAKNFIKARNETMEYCEKNGLVFSEHLQFSFPNECKNFKITKKGRQRTFYFVVSGKRENIDFVVMNYRYTDEEPYRESTFLGMKVKTRSGGRNKAPEYQATLCMLTLDKLNMPHFFIRDESFIMDSLGKLVGGQDINFAEDTAFSKKFVLQGEKESEIRTFFNSKVRSAFVNFHKKGFVYEAVGKYLFVFSPNNCEEIEKKMQFLADSIKFVPALTSSDSNKI